MFGVLADNPALTLFLVVVGRRARLADAPGVADGTVRFSFWRHGRSVEVASDQAVVEPGDHVVVIGAEEAVPEVTRYLGDTERRVSEVDAVSLGLGLSRATPPCSPSTPSSRCCSSRWSSASADRPLVPFRGDRVG